MDSFRFLRQVLWHRSRPTRQPRRTKHESNGLLATKTATLEDSAATEVDAKQIATSKDSHISVEDVRGDRSKTLGLCPSLSTSCSEREAPDIDTHCAIANAQLEAPSFRIFPRKSISEISTLTNTASEAGDDMDSPIIHSRDSTDNFSDESLPSDSKLRDKLCKARIEWPEHSFRYFIAVDDFDRIVTPESIWRELERCGMTFPNDEVREHTVDKIWKSAPRLFAILVCLKRGKLIGDFLDEAIDDTDLPFVRSDNTARSGHFKLCSRKTPDHPIKCMTTWDQARVNDFGRDQWCMLAPVFEYHDDVKHYELDDNCVLPWVEDDERSHRAIEGGFGSVWKIAIHPAHQRFVGNANQMSTSRFVAIKRLHSTHEANFRSEVSMLKKLKKRKHAHLVSLLATFHYKRHYYLIFPYAHCNLRQYWQHTPIPDFTQDTILWILRECRFVASALLMVHESRSTREFAYSLTESGGSGLVDSCSEEDMRIYGRHGDIKAENILWFEKNDGSPGLLVVADFGLMAFHTKDTRSDVDARHITGSPTYEPPEAMLGAKISRAFDIWSLGCLYLEFITWLVCGWEHLQRFPDVREMRGSPGPEFLDDTFFTIIENENRAVIRQTVIDWIADLHEMPRASTFVHEFLDLISGRLLLVIPGERIRIGQLNAELLSMLERAVKEAAYLTGSNPYPPRTQEPHLLSLAAFHRNSKIISPTTQQGVPLPKRLSGILDSDAPRVSFARHR